MTPNALSNNYVEVHCPLSFRGSWFSVRGQKRLRAKIAHFWLSFGGLNEVSSSEEDPDEKSQSESSSALILSK